MEIPNGPAPAPEYGDVAKRVTVQGGRAKMDDIEFVFNPPEAAQAFRWWEEVGLYRRVVANLTYAEQVFRMGEGEYDNAAEKLLHLVREHEKALQAYVQILRLVDKFVTPENFSQRFEGDGTSLQKVCEELMLTWQEKERAVAVKDMPEPVSDDEEFVEIARGDLEEDNPEIDPLADTDVLKPEEEDLEPEQAPEPPPYIEPPKKAEEPVAEGA